MVVNSAVKVCKNISNGFQIMGGHYFVTDRWTNVHGKISMSLDFKLGDIMISAILV